MVESSLEVRGFSPPPCAAAWYFIVFHFISCHSFYDSSKSCCLYSVCTSLLPYRPYLPVPNCPVPITSLVSLSPQRAHVLVGLPNLALSQPSVPVFPQVSSANHTALASVASLPFAPLPRSSINRPPGAICSPLDLWRVLDLARGSTRAGRTDISGSPSVSSRR